MEPGYPIKMQRGQEVALATCYVDVTSLQAQGFSLLEPIPPKPAPAPKPKGQK